MIERLRIIKYFKDNIKGETHGIYECVIDGEKRLLVKHGKEVGVICFWLDSPVTQCISRVNTEIIKELEEIIEQEAKQNEDFK
jgi:hypothetical protein